MHASSNCARRYRPDSKLDSAARLVSLIDTPCGPSYGPALRAGAEKPRVRPEPG